jgi:hypothetical protein
MASLNPLGPFSSPSNEPQIAVSTLSKEFQSKIAQICKIWVSSWQELDYYTAILNSARVVTFCLSKKSPKQVLSCYRDDFAGNMLWKFFPQEHLDRWQKTCDDTYAEENISSLEVLSKKTEAFSSQLTANIDINKKLIQWQYGRFHNLQRTYHPFRDLLSSIDRLHKLLPVYRNLIEKATEKSPQKQKSLESNQSLETEHIEQRTSDKSEEKPTSPANESNTIDNAPKERKYPGIYSHKFIQDLIDLPNEITTNYLSEDEALKKMVSMFKEVKEALYLSTIDALVTLQSVHDLALITDESLSDFLLDNIPAHPRDQYLFLGFESDLFTRKLAVSSSSSSSSHSSSPQIGPSSENMNAGLLKKRKRDE